MCFWWLKVTTLLICTFRSSLLVFWCFYTILWPGNNWPLKYWRSVLSLGFFMGKLCATLLCMKKWFFINNSHSHMMYIILLQWILNVFCYQIFFLFFVAFQVCLCNLWTETVVHICLNFHWTFLPLNWFQVLCYLAPLFPMNINLFWQDEVYFAFLFFFFYALFI